MICSIFMQKFVPIVVKEEFKKILDFLKERDFDVRCAEITENEREIGRYCISNGISYFGVSTGAYPNLMKERIEKAKQYHQNFHKISNKIKNAVIDYTVLVLGDQLNSKSDIVIGYSKSQTGTELQAIRIAKAENIPIFNLGNGYLFRKPEDFKIIYDGIENILCR